MKTFPLNDVVKSIGIQATMQYLPKGMKLHQCDLHGFFLSHYKNDNPLCSLCITTDPAANGTSATQVEHYIDLDPAQIGTNPGQKINPMGI